MPDFHGDELSNELAKLDRDDLERMVRGLPGLFSSRYFDGGQAIPKGVNV
jgi:hypothetical protein